MAKIKKETNHNIKYPEKMSIEDKILLILEYVCYFFTVCALIAIPFVIHKGLTKGAVILIFCIMGLIWCGLDARSSRDSHIDKGRLKSLANNRRVYKLLKWN